MTDDPQTHDVGAQLRAALEELFERGEQAVIDAGGEPVTLLEWRAPGVAPGEHDELIADALAAVREGPEDRGPAGAGPR